MSAPASVHIDMTGRVALVTGGGYGMGRASARRFAAAGASLKHEIPVMLGQGGGAIVNVASETTYKGNVGDIGYTASKHGVWGLTTVAGLRYAHRGIRINAVVPGNVETGITERAKEYLTPEQYAAMERAQPNRRLGRPEEVAEIVVWLCSDAASLVNASRVAADAGWHVA